MSVLNSLCDFCHSDIVKGLKVCTEYFCTYKCYNSKYDLEDDSNWWYLIP